MKEVDRILDQIDDVPYWELCIWMLSLVLVPDPEIGD